MNVNTSTEYYVRNSGYKARNVGTTIVSYPLNLSTILSTGFRRVESTDFSSSLEPIEVAARNAGEFFIDRIYDHRGTTTKRVNMEFLVSWKDYSQKDDTWEPFKAVCKTQAFVDYCYANKLVCDFVSQQNPTGLV